MIFLSLPLLGILNLVCAEDVHRSAITSVQFHPINDSKVLTNGMDSVIKIVDVRTCKDTHVFSHKDFQTSYGWSSSVFRPDGKKTSCDGAMDAYIVSIATHEPS